MHVDIARNIQGLSPNIPAIFALAAQIANKTLIFTCQILSLPMDSLYKQILVYRLVEIKALQYSTNQTGPVAEIARILREYNMIEHINSFIENGIVMSKGEWKKIVNDKVKDKENKEWTATRLLYRGLNDFKSTGINLKPGCPWWEVDKWDCFSTKCWTHNMWMHDENPQYALILKHKRKVIYMNQSIWISWK